MALCVCCLTDVWWAFFPLAQEDHSALSNCLSDGLTPLFRCVPCPLSHGHSPPWSDLCMWHLVLFPLHETLSGELPQIRGILISFSISLQTFHFPTAHLGMSVSVSSFWITHGLSFYGSMTGSLAFSHYPRRVLFPDSLSQAGRL